MGFFWGGKKTAEAYDNAARFLADGDAVMIDLRHNGGGSPDAVQYLISHFVEPNTADRHLLHGRGQDRPPHEPRLAPCGTFVGKPLYVLTSGTTASAAEEFVGHVAGFKLGEVIGENTAGAGFRNQFFPVEGGYVISVSVGRAVLASTGKDWKASAFAPTIEGRRRQRARRGPGPRAPANRHLPRAAMRKRRLEAQAALLDAKVNPAAPALPAERYAGSYDGGRSVTIDGGTLSYQRAQEAEGCVDRARRNEFGGSTRTR